MLRVCGLGLFVQGLAAAGTQGGAPKSVEVVLSHYTEDLDWMKDYANSKAHFTVYSKADHPPEFAIQLPNVGRESHTYLYHIVNQYDHLADWTVFSQAIRPTWGYHGGGHASGHLSDTVTFEDYMKPYPNGSDSMFLLNAASQFPSGRQTNRLGFMIKNILTDKLSKDICPVGGASGWTPWWWDKSHPQLKKKAAGELNMLQFYHKHIAQDENDGQPITLAFAQGGRFAVSKERIHRRPREYYEALLDQLSMSPNPIAGYWMEAAWYDVFHPEALQSKHTACELPVAPAGLGLSIPDLRQEIIHRAVEDGIIDPASPRAMSEAYDGITSTTNAATTLPAEYTKSDDTTVLEGELGMQMTKADADKCIADKPALEEAINMAFTVLCECFVNLTVTDASFEAGNWSGDDDERRLSDSETGYLAVEYEMEVNTDEWSDFKKLIEDLGTNADDLETFIALLEQALEEAGLDVEVLGIEMSLPEEVTEDEEDEGGTSGTSPPSSRASHTKVFRIVLGGALAPLARFAF